MSIFKKIGKKMGIVEKTKTDEIMDKRAELKKTIAKNLKNIGFTNKEVSEVLDILKKSEEEIQIEKDSLIGSNINNERTLEIMDASFIRIREIELQAAQDMKDKIAQIQKRKQSQNP